jgi:tRNA pseudouridine55 synthase
MDGIIIVNKPKDWTSFDVVAKLRNLARVKKVGHSGTLDPLATGVLPVFIGRATKTISRFLNGDKGYEGAMQLGIKTDSGDAAGKIIAQKEFTPIPRARIEEAFRKFTGPIKQVPPMYSAVKVGGQRLYELARKGISIERRPKKVVIHELRLLAPESEELFSGLVPFSVRCSKGTYVRQLAEDIGEELGCGAHLANLIRTYAEPFHISQAIEMETLITMAKAGVLASVVLSPEEIIEALEHKK